ncbi:MAG: diacylglycerol kinase (ATP) [Thermoproteota archaeon]|jgi:diacylglycerol kinase (ATP)
MLIVLNKNSNGGKGIKKWDSIKKYLAAEKINYKLLVTSNFEEAKLKIDSHLKEYPNETIISAGGDGTANGLINHLMNAETNSLNYPITFGALGLGSSNDFHKPVSEQHRINKHPAIIPNKSLGQNWDLGKAVFVNDRGEKQTRYFSINSSIGLTANGNDFFNQDTWVLRLLKNIHLEVANIWTIFNILMNIKSLNVEVDFFDERSQKQIKSKVNTVNMGFLKKRNVSGGMSYDTEVQFNDGCFDIVNIKPMGRLGLLKIITNLYSGNFVGTDKTNYWKAKKMKLKSDEVFNLEFDGEVFKATEVDFEVIQGILPLC